MKFAVPLAEGKLTTHFGHCQQFAILDVENSEIVKQDFLTPPPMNPECCRNGFMIWERM
jgi:predicted Fe-Mo cluster-binding NifX family protein